MSVLTRGETAKQFRSAYKRYKMASGAGGDESHPYGYILQQDGEIIDWLSLDGGLGRVQKQRREGTT
jgi:hypothetical protein